MTEIFLTSDHHFGHKNILKYQPDTRPFSSVEEMNEALVENHNELVKPNDIVYMLGDFAFTSEERAKGYLKRMNGRKYFIYGNHDKNIRKNDFSDEFVWAKDYSETKILGKNVCLFHFPIHSWNKMHYGAYQFYGHTHGQIPHLYHGRSMDVGVDTNKCYPWNASEIFEMYAKVREESEQEDFDDDPRGRTEKR